jgi:hypothetical protein
VVAHLLEQLDDLLDLLVGPAVARLVQNILQRTQSVILYILHARFAAYVPSHGSTAVLLGRDRVCGHVGTHRDGLDLPFQRPPGLVVTYEPLDRNGRIAVSL